MTLGSMELSRRVHAALRQITTQIEFCILVIGIDLGHCQSHYTKTQDKNSNVATLSVAAMSMNSVCTTIWFQ